MNTPGGTHMALRPLNADERRAASKSLFGAYPDETRLTSLAEVAPKSDLGSTGRGGLRTNTPFRIVSESGLYKLTMRSDKAQARQFQDWVTRVVLPSIRKHGGYVAGQEKPNGLASSWPPSTH